MSRLGKWVPHELLVENRIQQMNVYASLRDLSRHCDGFPSSNIFFFPFESSEVKFAIDPFLHTETITRHFPELLHGAQFWEKLVCSSSCSTEPVATRRAPLCCYFQRRSTSQDDTTCGMCRQLAINILRMHFKHFPYAELRRTVTRNEVYPNLRVPRFKNTE